VRRAHLKVLYQGTEITSDVSPSILSLSITDHAEGKADNLELTVHDRESLWKSGWMPQEGATFQVIVHCDDWIHEGDRLKLDHGAFVIDEIEFSGPPSVCKIKAVSKVAFEALSGEAKTEIWDDVSLEEIQRMIAQDNELEPVYLAGQTVWVRHAMQAGESDLSFLDRLALLYGFSVKISDKKLILFDAVKLVTELPTVTIQRSSLTHYSLKAKTCEIYSHAEVPFEDPDGKGYDIYTCHDPTLEEVLGIGFSRALRTPIEASNLEDAKLIAEGQLRWQNQNRFKGDLNMIGNPKLMAGVPVQLQGFGKLDKIYFAEKVVHHLDKKGYQTTVSIRGSGDWESDIEEQQAFEEKHLESAELDHEP
jgi:uncharacterized protein